VTGVQKCPDCAAENSDDAQKCDACSAALAGVESRHQSFARRLTELQDAMVSAEPGTGRKTEERRFPVQAPVIRSPRVQERTHQPLHREELMGHALQELERQARHGLVVQIALSGTLLMVMVLSAVIFLASLVMGSGWPVIVAAAAAGTFTLVCLFVLQLSHLGRRQQRLALLMAQLEAARRALEHSFDLWDEFLAPRMGKLTAEEMALAVDSLGRGGQVIVGELASSQEPAGGGRNGQTPASSKDKGAVNPAVASKY
jgi:ABC-type multidrug transport system fused ATPase/permease subunit